MRAFIALLFILQTLIILPVHGGKQFRLGRRKGGNLGSPGEYKGQQLPPAQWFSQKLDHFNPTDTRTWKQRYFVNTSFYDFDNPGPVFIMIGGEGPADARWMVTGAWIDYAIKFKAFCINLEHRYYGESHPTRDLSVENLRYLSSAQALADLANFITAMQDKYKFKSDVRWIAFGGSYPGSLAAWSRLKYPHLIYAAVSSSGPLLAKVNFMEYFQEVVESLRRVTSSNECVEQLKLAHEQIEMMIKVHPEVIEKEFKVCKPFANASADDMTTFYNGIADDFADLVQYNEDNRISLNEKYRNVTIATVCKILTSDEKIEAYKKLARFNSITLEKSNQTCMDYSYQSVIDDLKYTSWGGDEARQWMYQTCTEFGFYQTSSAEVEVFGNKFGLDYYVKQCQEVFDKKYDEQFITQAADWTNSFYGAKDISVNRVVFVHGSIDPWHALGITSTEDENAPAIYIKGTAHCANMYPPSPRDPESLVEARLEIQQFLANWIYSP